MHFLEERIISMYSHRIEHLRLAPKNIDYWDYTILCHGDDAVARVLQRFEYWDGTKAGGNVHGEEINEQLQASGHPPTQDVSRYVYKTIEELAWEMLGSVSERSLPKALDLLCDSLGYLKRRNNPYSTFDHTKQYEFQEALVVEHLGRLRTIVETFLEQGRQIRPVLYAIEQLTRRGVYVAHLAQQADGSFLEESSKPILTVACVATELCAMHRQVQEDSTGKKKPTLPRFVRSDLLKDERRGFSATSSPSALPESPEPLSPPEISSSPSTPLDDSRGPSRFGNFAETNDAGTAPSNPQCCRNSMANLPKQHGNFAETIPLITSVITTTAAAGATVSENAPHTAISPASPAAAAALSFSFETLSPDEVTLIQASCQQRQHDEQAGTTEPGKVSANEGDPFVQRADTPMREVANLDTPDAPMSEAHPERDVTDETNQAPVRQAETEQPATACPGDAEEAVFGVAANTHQSIAPPLEQTLSTRVGEGTPPLPPGQQASSPDAEPALTPEAIVTLFERLQKHPYDRVARAMQLAAAPILLELDRTGQLALPLTERLLVRVYDEQSNDPYWKRTHGTLDVTDLVGREKSGQIRIVRWIARYIPPTRRARTGATVTPTPEQRAGQRPIIGVSGFPVFQPSKTPMKVLPPPPPARRPGIHLAVAARGV
jgi:hypothetical protein